MSSVDYADFAERLIAGYVLKCLSVKPVKVTGRDAGVVRQIVSLAFILDKYSDPEYSQCALDTLDLSKIYPDDDGGCYDDTLIRNLLQYFKSSFFSWVNKETCSQCNSDAHMELRGAHAFPENQPNPDGCGTIEQWYCTRCNVTTPFHRINNPLRLLQTRRGRCGEWVNCFLLCMVAVLGDDATKRVRYMWNHEDHVWCEYYSKAERRWIHLDPCEAAYDEPRLYCDNWGKQMSLVVAFGQDYAIDLSAKYITREKQIPLLNIVSSPRIINNAIKAVNAQLFRREMSDTGNHRQDLLKLYHKLIVPYNRERIGASSVPSKTLLPVGRQSGGIEWTSARGESGNKKS